MHVSKLIRPQTYEHSIHGCRRSSKQKYQYYHIIDMLVLLHSNNTTIRIHQFFTSKLSLSLSLFFLSAIRAETNLQRFSNSAFSTSISRRRCLQKKARHCITHHENKMYKNGGSPSPNTCTHTHTYIYSTLPNVLWPPAFRRASRKPQALHIESKCQKLIETEKETQP